MKSRRKPKPANAKSSRNKLILAGAIAACSGCALADVTPPQMVPLPDFNATALGTLGINGAFDGLSIYRYEGEESIVRQPDNVDDFLVQTAPDVFTRSPLADGSIWDSCLLSDNNTAILAGNFTTIASTACPMGIARLDLSSGQATAMGNVSSISSGQVRTIWCNGTNVYAGGSFAYGGKVQNNTFGVAVWNNTAESWSSPLFGGFIPGSEVHTIANGPTSDSVVFGGLLKGIASSAGNSSSLNSSTLPGTQRVSFGLAEAEGFAYAGAAPVNITSSVLCPASNINFEAGLDSTTGSLDVTIGYEVVPDRIRIYNLANAGSGTSLFRLTTQPSGSIMNLTYTDPLTGVVKNCDAYCPLAPANQSRSQDFNFVNYVPTTSLSIELLGFYGTQAGLSGIELYEQGQSIYADQSFMNSDCFNGTDAAEMGNIGSVQLEGPGWNAASQGYEETTIYSTQDLQDIMATFLPAVTEGLYSLDLYTPACGGACSQRGGFNVTVYPGPGLAPVSEVLFQTNEAVKYDPIYRGLLTSNSSIVMRPILQNPLPLNFVAWKLAISYLGPSSKWNATAVFEYSATNFTTWMHNATFIPVGGPLNFLGSQLGANATVNGIANTTNGYMVGGANFANFSSNLIALSNSNGSGISFSGNVTGLTQINSTTFALGNNGSAFVVNNSGATQIAESLVSSVVPLNLNGSDVVVLSPPPGNGTNTRIPLWNISQNSLVNQSSALTLGVRGHVSGALTPNATSPNATTFYFGSLQLVDSLADGSLDYAGDTLTPLAYSFVSPSSVSRKRAASDSGASAGGTIKIAGYINLTTQVLVGQFNASVSDGSTVSNLIVNAGNSTTALDGISNVVAGPGGVNALAINNKTAAFGGSFTNDNTSGLVLYDVQQKQAASQQPSALSGTTNIASLAFLPNDTAALVVAGSFSDNSCPSVCLFNVTESKWSKLPGLELDGNSTGVQIAFDKPDRMVMTGNFTWPSHESIAHMLLYNTTDGTNTTIDGLPGYPVSLVMTGNDSSTFVATGRSESDGSPYIAYYADNQWHEVTLPFNSSSEIASMSVVPMNSNYSNSPLKSSQAILVSGSLIFQNSSGPISSVIWDGSTFTPFLLTSSALSGQSSSISGVYGLFSQLIPRLDGGVSSGNVNLIKQSPKPTPRPRPPPRPVTHRHYMETGHVVGVSCAIAIGCVSLIVGLYLLGAWIFGAERRSREGPMRVAYQSLQKAVPPETLMEDPKSR